MSKVFIEEDTLSAIGNAIREKTNKEELIAPGDMPTEISNIETGEALPEELFTFTGNLRYLFSNPAWNTFIDTYKDKIKIQGSYLGKIFCNNAEIIEIPFSVSQLNGPSEFDSAFYGCTSLKKIGDINNLYVSYFKDTFCYCSQLRKLPNFNNLEFYTSNFAYDYASNFYQCYSLREIPITFFNKFNEKIKWGSKYSSLYYQTFCYNSSLDELIGIPVIDIKLTENNFYNTFMYCERLKNIVFATEEDGSAKVRQWANQVIDLTARVGYGYSSSHFYNSGITADKQVKDDYSYNSLKDDPDWWTSDINYSRYNHESAARTIASLPDTSAFLASNGGTNTIKFKAKAGKYTYATGAINTLYADEIAVATSKGWTVSFVS